MTGDELDRAAEWLQDRGNAVPVRSFPKGLTGVHSPGLYAWWTDSQGAEELAEAFKQPLPLLIYAGQAGATRWPSGQRSSATLESRIRSNHLNGRISGSTFRFTLAALLRETHDLSAEAAGRLTRASRDTLDIWIRSHLMVAVFPHSNRDNLLDLEEAALNRLDPPLNLDGRPATHVRDTIRDLRRVLRRQSVRSGVNPAAKTGGYRASRSGVSAKKHPASGVSRELSQLLNDLNGQRPIHSVGQGKPNWIVGFDSSSVFVETNASRSKGNSAQAVPNEWIVESYQTLMSDGFLDRSNLGYQASHRSAFIFALLAELADVRVEQSPIRLVWKPSADAPGSP